MVQKRRSQLRHSQETYRKKKEAANKRCIEYTAQLEACINHLQQMLEALHEHALQSNLNVLNPQVYAQLRNINAFLGVGVISTHTTSYENVAVADDAPEVNAKQETDLLSLFPWTTCTI